MNASQVDVAVIGGGPAGVAAAIPLARRGLSVALFEAKRFPRDTLCGEFLSPECMGLLANLGVRINLSELGAVPIRQVRITSSGGGRWEAPLPGAAAGLSRELFDLHMIDQARAAGVQVQEGSRVATVTGSLPGGFYLTVQSNGAWREVEAQAVIGAQGKRSRLDAALGRQFITRPQPFVALKAHFWGPAIPGRIELYAFPGGYCGLSEIEGDRRNLCLLVSQAVFQRRRQGAGDPVSNFIEWMGTQNPSLGEWLSQAERIHPWMAIAQVPFSPKPPLEQDMLMAGDAAGLIVPLAGDGIAMALESGQLASDCLVRYLAGEWTEGDVRSQYPALWRARFETRMRWARALQPLLMSPTLTPLIIRILLWLPALGNALIVNTRGRTPQSTGG